jgi:nitrile hydratase
MDGIHDLGGKEGFGRIEYEADEPVFHAHWEARVFGLYLQRLGGAGNIDRRRHAVERIDPRTYLDHGYYGRWLGGMETLLVEGGVLDAATIDARARALGARPDDLVAARPSATPDIPAYTPGKQTCDRPLARPARFRVGDTVTTLRHGVAGHTRLPAYARGCTGTIVLCHGGWVYPDHNAHGRGEDPQHLYTVAFDGAELWGGGGEPGVTVHLDLFEPYLRGAGGSSGPS